MNTMLNNGGNNVLSQVMKFADDIRKSGKSPQQILDEAMASGKYTKAQLENAKKMAEQFAKTFR